MSLRLIVLMSVLFSGLAWFSVACAESDEFKGSAEEREKLVAEITQQRMAIEARKSTLKQQEVSTAKLNERIKQKWSKIHFYSENGELVRVKTYPHPGISTRTEEFYYQDGDLIFAYIEDDGTTEDETGGAHQDGKEYYYHKGQFVEEKNMSGEKEYSIRHSDEERLEAEATEYQDIFNSLKQ